jgi:cation/acetate symporter
MAAGLGLCILYFAGTRYFAVDFYEAWPQLSNASEGAVRKFASLKAAWETASAGDAKATAWAALEAQARGAPGKIGVANWFGVPPSAAALFGLPAGLLAIALLSLLTPRHAPRSAP